MHVHLYFYVDVKEKFRQARVCVIVSKKGSDMPVYMYFYVDIKERLRQAYKYVLC